MDIDDFFGYFKIDLSVIYELFFGKSFFIFRMGLLLLDEFLREIKFYSTG